MAVFTGYREVNAVNSVSTGNGKSKFVHMPNSVNTLKILVGIYFRELYTFYVKMQYFTRVHSLQSIIQIMDQAARRTPTHQLKALRACRRAWVQVLGLGRLLLGVPVRDVPAGAGPGGPDARPGSAVRPPSAPAPALVLDDSRAPTARDSSKLPCLVCRPFCQSSRVFRFLKIWRHSRN